jgi:hypothetical protein
MASRVAGTGTVTLVRCGVHATHDAVSGPRGRAPDYTGAARWRVIAEYYRFVENNLAVSRDFFRETVIFRDDVRLGSTQG